jgi:hypothetical protein
MSEWIKVTDRLPPKDHDFLGYVLLGFHCSGLGKDNREKKSIQTCLWNGSKYMESCNCSGSEHDPEYIEVICWMPLPEAPKYE